MKRFSAFALAFALSLSTITAGIAQTVTPLSGLPAASSVLSSDFVLCVHAGVTSKCTVSQLAPSTSGPTIWSGAGTLGTGAQTFCAQDGGTVAGIVCNIPTSSTNGFTWTVNNGSPIMQLVSGSLKITGQTAYSGAGSGITGPNSGQLLDDDAGGGGWNFSWATGSGYGLRFWKGLPGTTAVATIGPASGIATIDATGAAMAPVLPVYGTGSAAINAYAHAVFGTCTTASSATCTISLTGTGAPYTSGSTWGCFGSAVATVVGVFVYLTAGGTTAVAEFNDGAARTAQINFACIGY